MTTQIEYKKVPREVLVASLRARDGDNCMHPSCGRPIDFTITDGPWEPTLDHTEPQSWCKTQGWSMDKIWAVENLTLFHKKCNADKGDRRYVDGVLPPKPQSRFRYRRDKRATNPDICISCAAGRNLGPDEVCAACGSGPMPERFPRWAKMKSTDCDHEAFWCWACSIGIVPRAGATEMLLIGGEGGDE